MQEKSGNFISHIHDTDYTSEYRSLKLNHSNLINNTGRIGESLNGTWNFGVDWYDTCRRAHWFQDIKEDKNGRPLPLDWDWEAWDTIPVPSCWNQQKKELRYFEGSGVYTRTFRYVKKMKDERCFLRFEGSNYQTSVFLNGQHLGTHDGGSTPFSVEATDWLKTENRIVVVVEARRRPDRVPMENTDWFNYGGLYRDVTLIRTPSVFIKDWFLRLVNDGTFGTIAFDVELNGEVDGIVQLIIDELNIHRTVNVSQGHGKITFTAKPELWSPENPRLYAVEIKAIEGSSGLTFDSIKDRIGFKELRVSGQDILLNGRPIYLKGICVHEDHVELGKTTTEEIIRSTIAHLKELHGNYLRLAHYPHDGRFARIADEEGVLLWSEVPVYWAIAFDNTETYTDAENQLSELILRDRNRVSAAIWSVGNENADTDERLSFMSRLVARARALDGTRPISAACLIDHERLAIADRLASHLDIIGINEYYGWYDPDFTKLPQILENSHPDKPVIICEFGAGARKGQRGTVNDLFTEDMQKNVYENQVAVIASCSYIKGTTPWILYDFRCPRRLNRYQELYNRKGLIDADRKTKKAAFWVLADFYKALC